MANGERSDYGDEAKAGAEQGRNTAGSGNEAGGLASAGVSGLFGDFALSDELPDLVSLDDVQPGGARPTRKRANRQGQAGGDSGPMVSNFLMNLADTPSSGLGAGRSSANSRASANESTSIVMGSALPPRRPAGERAAGAVPSVQGKVRSSMPDESTHIVMSSGLPARRAEGERGSFRSNVKQNLARQSSESGVQSGSNQRSTQDEATQAVRNLALPPRRPEGERGTFKSRLASGSSQRSEASLGLPPTKPPLATTPVTQASSESLAGSLARPADSPMATSVPFNPPTVGTSAAPDPAFGTTSTLGAMAADIAASITEGNSKSLAAPADGLGQAANGSSGNPKSVEEIKSVTIVKPYEPKPVAPRVRTAGSVLKANPGKNSIPDPRLARHSSGAEGEMAFGSSSGSNLRSAPLPPPSVPSAPQAPSWGSTSGSRSWGTSSGTNLKNLHSIGELPVAPPAVPAAAPAEPYMRRSVTGSIFAKASREAVQLPARPAEPVAPAQAPAPSTASRPTVSKGRKGARPRKLQNSLSEQNNQNASSVPGASRLSSWRQKHVPGRKQATAERQTAWSSTKRSYVKSSKAPQVEVEPVDPVFQSGLAGVAVDHRGVTMATGAQGVLLKVKSASQASIAQAAHESEYRKLRGIVEQEEELQREQQEEAVAEGELQEMQDLPESSPYRYIASLRQEGASEEDLLLADLLEARFYKERAAANAPEGGYEPEESGLIAPFSEDGAYLEEEIEEKVHDLPSLWRWLWGRGLFVVVGVGALIVAVALGLFFGQKLLGQDKKPTEQNVVLPSVTEPAKKGSYLPMGEPELRRDYVMGESDTSLRVENILPDKEGFQNSQPESIEGDPFPEEESKDEQQRESLQKQANEGNAHARRMQEAQKDSAQSESKARQETTGSGNSQSKHSKPISPAKSSTAVAPSAHPSVPSSGGAVPDEVLSSSSSRRPSAAPAAPASSSVSAQSSERKANVESAGEMSLPDGIGESSSRRPKGAGHSGANASSDAQTGSTGGGWDDEVKTP